MPETTKQKQARLVSELKGVTCRCGSMKARSQTFCRKCYFRLPHIFRNALYRKVGEGYEEACDQAVEHLDKYHGKKESD